MEKKKKDACLSEAGGGTDHGHDHPCEGCLHFYGAYKNNRCCNYIFDRDTPRPCPPGEKCTEKHLITSKKDLQIRKGGYFY